MSNPFVATDAIKAALRGHETQVLDALHIPWRRGHHVTCPYPGHDDHDPSWRWDEAASLAFCTCTKSDGILDVIGKVRGIDFEASKLAAAEMLGRRDLIHETGRGMSAERLLAPPDLERDDGLVMAYLHYRLDLPIGTLLAPLDADRRLARARVLGPGKEKRRRRETGPRRQVLVLHLRNGRR
jgi:hypothetical protein